MPRQCTLCIHDRRKEIEKALVSGTSYRNIAERYGSSLAALNRHKAHLSQAVVKAAERREERLGDSLLDEMQRLKGKIWAMLESAERDGDRVSFSVLAREFRQTLGGYFELAERAMPKSVNPSIAERIRQARERFERLRQEEARSGRCHSCGRPVSRPAPAGATPAKTSAPAAETNPPTVEGPVKSQEQTGPVTPAYDDWVSRVR